uniref:Integrase catalytic domain-containing protein n=1 Tax=Ascaris lumbricoides TaxID=6252 RepID=A0A0M3I6V8_ASCLU
MDFRRWRARPFRLPTSPPLPTTRTFPANLSLTKSGKEKTKDGTKRWIALFTCLWSRIVHFEVVSDCSGQAFLLSLYRFIARRGQPRSILSDNASTLLLAERAIDQILNKIQWKHITERAPWQGGIYERMVQMVQVHEESPSTNDWQSSCQRRTPSNITK